MRRGRKEREGGEKVLTLSVLSTLYLYHDDMRIQQMWAGLERHIATCTKCSAGVPCPAGKCLDTKLETLIFYRSQDQESTNK